MFRLRQKRSDSQLPPAHSEPESHASPEFQPPAEPLSEDNGGSRIESSSEGDLDAERRLELALREVKDFLAGGPREVSRIDPAEKVVRATVAGELLAVISAGDSKAGAHSSDPGSGGHGDNMSPANAETGDSLVQQDDLEGTDAAQTEQSRARQLFMDHGYFDEAIGSLRAAASPSERAAAARTIGMVGNQLGSVHLIAALFDDAPEVRDAVSEALARLGDSAASVAAMANPPANGGPPAPFAGEVVSDSSPEEAVEQEMPAEKDAASLATVDDNGVPAHETKLLLEEQAKRENLEDLQQRLGDTVIARTRLEKETGLRLESEARLSAEVAARRREEEKLRRRAEEESLRHRTEEEEKLAAAHAASIKADEEARRLAQEDATLRNEVNKLRLVAEELARTRADMKAERAATAERARLAETERARQEAAANHKAETDRMRSEEDALRSAAAESAARRAEVEAARQEAERDALRLAEEREQLAAAEAARRAEIEAERQEAERDALRLAEEKEQLAAAEAARRAEADRVRREADERARIEQEQLLAHVEEMRLIAEEVAVRRGEVEAAREKATEEAQRLLEAQARMKAAEQSRQQAERERLQLEANIVQRAEEERRLLDEARQRAQEEQRQIEEEERYRAAEHEQRVAQLVTLRQRMETEAQQRAETERQISSQIESFRIAEMQARKRIEEAEARRRSADERYRLTAEKMQRVEAEARKGELEEERILAKLEEVRRNVAVATHSAEEQEKRIKDETEQLRRLEETQRHRVEQASRGRVEAEQRWQQEKERFKLEEDARLRASEQLKRLLEPEPPEIAEDSDEWRDDPSENLRPSRRAAGAQGQTTFAVPPGVSTFGSAGSTVPAAYGETKSAAAQSSSSGNWAQTAAAPALTAPALVSERDVFNRISASFDDPSPDVRNAAARELRELDPLHMVEWLNRALEEATAERRRNIGSAIAASGLATEVIDLLGGESREDTYSALCLLLAMAKGGEVQPLIDAIENHENVYVRIAAVRLLTLNGQEEIANAAARRRLEGHK